MESSAKKAEEGEGEGEGGGGSSGGGGLYASKSNPAGCIP